MSSLPTTARGTHTVGYTWATRQDHARRFFPADSAPPTPRPVHMSIWYPTAECRGLRLSYGDYARLIGREGWPHFDPLEAAERATTDWREFVASVGGAVEGIPALFSVPMAACRESQPLAGRLPLVLVAPGFDGTPALHAALGEYLASHGWIVASAPAMGADRRAMAWSSADVVAQRDDLAFIMNAVLREWPADPESVSVIGFSFGSGAAVLLGTSSPAVGAVVSLDGSIGFRDRIPTFRSVPEWGRLRMEAPLLHLNVEGYHRNDLGELLRVTAEPLLVASFLDAAHMDFTTLGLLSDRIPGLRHHDRGVVSARAAAVHLHALPMIREFLDSARAGAAVVTAVPGVAVRSVGDPRP